MNLPREGAKFCTSKCRVYSFRAAKRSGLPVEMTSRDRWMRRSALKRPITVRGKSASSTDPRTWSPYVAAVASPVGAGLGFALGDGIGCIDLDHCLDGAVLQPWAAEIVAANPNTYIEVSMSGTGLHIFGLIAEAPGRKLRDGRNIEVYSQGRYIAVTGDSFGKAPVALAELILI